MKCVNVEVVLNLKTVALKINNMLKDITFNGRKFQYVVNHHASEYGDYVNTSIFEGTETITKQKYWLCGPMITETKPKEIYTIGYDIERVDKTKAEVRASFQRMVDLLDRAEEIKNGKII